jgi:hypothetical protein
MKKNPFAPSKFRDFDRFIVLENHLILQVTDDVLLNTQEL